jgi:N-formylglutamate amidohydrolase
MARKLDALIEADTPGLRWRLQGSGIRRRPTEAPVTAEIVAALEQAGVTVQTRSSGSATNADSYHCDATFEQGRLTGVTGNYWHSPRGVWIEGPRALAFISVIMDRPLSVRLLRELRSADPTIDDYLAARYAERAVVFNVPHASTSLPVNAQRALLLSEQALADEVRRMTDHFTDELVANVLPVAPRVIANVSRLVVDTERFPEDDDEPMSRIGMGMIYERTSGGELLRQPPSKAVRRRLKTEYYDRHHAELAQCVERALRQSGRCLVLDIHSFPSRPLPYESDQNPQRPDICLGTDDFHTPAGLASVAQQAFEGMGLTVAVNRPFSGTIVPAAFYRTDRRVTSLMIEINRRLYMNEETGAKQSTFSAVQGMLGRVIPTIALGTNHPL